MNHFVQWFPVFNTPQLPPSGCQNDIAPVFQKGAKCHFQIISVMCSKLFNYWSSMICKKGDNCTIKNNQEAFVICKTEPSSCSCKIDVFCVVPFLQNRSDIYLIGSFTPSRIPLVLIQPFGIKHDVSQVNLFRS
jgi:hypothetical protein